MDNLVSLAIVLSGIVYSVMLLIVCSSIASDLVLSQTTKKWLIALAILLPVFGMFITASKTVAVDSTPGAGSDNGTSNTTTGDYGSSGGCGGGGE